MLISGASMRYVHTNLVARDWQRLASFYQEVFSCEPVPPQRDQRGEWLERGTGVDGAGLRGMHLRLPGGGPDGPTLEIFQYDEVRARPEPAANRQGYGHLAFAVDDVAATLERMLAAGGRRVGEVVSREVKGAGRVTFVYAADPEGNLLELQRWESLEQGADVAPVRAGYERWAEHYDHAPNPTRDLGALVLRRLLPELAGREVLELGCGTGKNTEALLGARMVVGLDFSAGMLARLRAKLGATHLHLVRHDLTAPLPFAAERFDLATANLVLEHVADLEPVFREVARVLRPGGRFLVVEFHPYRQLDGKQARFLDPDTGETVRVAAYPHPVSAFTAAAVAAGLRLERLGEWLDGGEPATGSPDVAPRVLSLELCKD